MQEKRKEIKKENMKENKKELMQKKYFEYQLVEQQVKQFQQQLENFQQQLSDLTDVKSALDDLKTVKEETEIFVPVSSGIFVKARLIPPEKVLVNVGSGTVVERPLGAAQQLLQGQEKELTEYTEKVQENLTLLQQHLMTLQEELKELVGEE
mgnify:CR=1 FL=1